MGSLISLPVNMLASCACSCLCTLFMNVFNATLSQATRFGHILILITIFATALVAGNYYSVQLAIITSSFSSGGLTKGCSNENLTNMCIQRQLIYRSSASCFLFFFFMAIVAKYSDYINRQLWVVKFTTVFGIFIGTLWLSNDVFSIWTEIIRYLSFVWLLAQGLLLLDFAHDCHEVIISKADQTELTGESARYWYSLYLLLCVSFFGSGIIGIVYLFQSYTDCSLGKFFVITTLVIGILQLILSVLNVINKGLLTPCIIFSYSVFMCWYALLSSPYETCKTVLISNFRNNLAEIIIVLLTILIIIYCSIYGSTILNIFNTEAESGVMMSQSNNSAFKAVVTGEFPVKSITHQPLLEPNSINQNNDDNNDNDILSRTSRKSGTAHERVFFHLLLMFISCYTGMILTSWGTSDGSDLTYSSTCTSNCHASSSSSTSTNSEIAGTSSMWLKVVSQWVLLILYFKVLHIAYTENSS